MRGLISVFALGLAACTAPNPAYEDSGDLSTSTAETTSTGTSGLATEGDSTGEAVCELHPDERFELLADRNGLPLDIPCAPANQVVMIAAGSSIFDGTTIIHKQCLPDDMNCLCTGTEFRIELSIGGQPAFAPGVPSCGPIYLWSAPSRTNADGCEWGGLMMQELVEGELVLTPAFFAARTLAVPAIAPTFALELAPEGDSDPACAGDCQPHPPGRYQLDVLGSLVPADGLTHFVEVSFLDGLDPTMYIVDNRMSSVTQDCESQLAWTAVVN